MSAVPTCVSLAPATPPGDSKLLLTGSADQSVKLWDVQTGRELFSFEHKGPVRCVAWAEGEHEFASISDPFGLALPAAINVFTFADEKDKQSDQPRLVITDKEQPRLKVTRVAWLPLNAALLASYDNGMLRKLDPTTGAVLGEWREHTGSVSSFAMNDEKTLLITSSHDRTAKLWDVAAMRVLKTYTADVPLNSAALSPLKEHVIIGGGQEAMSVTTTAVSAGKFETRFHHLVLENELGRIKGHFGPINALAFHPDGRSFASGAEDGYIRVHHMDPDYDALGEGDNLEDPALSRMLADGTYERLMEEEAAAKAKEEEKAAAIAAAQTAALPPPGSAPAAPAVPKKPTTGLIAALMQKGGGS